MGTSLIYPPGGRSFAGAYLGTADGAALPAVAGKTPGDYYVITTAGGGYAIGDMAVVNSAASAYEKIAAAVLQTDSTNITSVATWRSALGVPSTSEVQRIASATPAGGVQFDGFTSLAGITGNLSEGGQSTVGSGDLSIHIKLFVPTNTASAKCIFGLTSSASTIAAAGAITCTLNTSVSDNLSILLYGATTGDYRYARYVGLPSTYAGQVIDVHIVRKVSDNDIKLYVNGTLVSATTEVTAGTPPNWSDPATVSYAFIGKHSSSASWNYNGSIYAFRVFNRALSVTDISYICSYGLHPADIGASCVNLIDASTNNGGFETAGGGGADVFASWTETTAGTSTINRDTGKFRTGAASCRFDISAGGDDASVSIASLLTPNKRHRVSAYVRGTGTSPQAGFNFGNTNRLPGGVVNDASWQYCEVESIVGDPSAGGGTGTSSSVLVGRHTGMANGSLWIDDLVVTRIGVVFDPDLAVGWGRVIPDMSGNGSYTEAANGVYHIRRSNSACINISRVLTHSQISSTAATTKLFDLPPNCAVVSVDLNVTSGFDAATTVEIGIAGTTNKFLSATAVNSTGLSSTTAPNSTARVSASVFTPVYIKKNQATTTGALQISVVVESRA